MGANGSKSSGRSDSSEKILTAEEKKHIHTLFLSIKDSKVASLQTLWIGKMDPHLEELMMKYLSKNHTKSTIIFQDFEKLFAHLVRGTVDDICSILIEMLTNSKNTESIPRIDLHNYVESLIKSYISTSSSYGWRPSSAAQVQRLSDSLCEALPPDVGYDKLSSWITNSPKVFAIQASILGNLYEVQTSIQRILPTCHSFNTPSILDTASVMFINASLPAALRNEWRLLFSSGRHGESFSKFIGFVQNKGPSVLIVRDKHRHVFGGFAPHAWVLGPNYAGDETTFLFRLKPSMNIYNTTGYNNHYQYLNVQQQTMPNGLGMGGQFEYWGLWIDAEYGKGQCSETCTTFRDCRMLSATKEFHIDHLEAWAVGPLPVVEDLLSQRSILDTNTEAKAILEMSGKVSHSDGYREPQEEDM